MPQLKKVREFEVDLFSPTGVQNGSTIILDVASGDGIVAADANIDDTSLSVQGGMNSVISDSQQNNTSFNISGNNSGLAGVEPQTSYLIQACARVLNETRVLTVNTISGSFTRNENITISTSLGFVLTADANTAGVSAIDVTSDGAGTLNIGTKFTIAGDVTIYTSTAEVVYAGVESQSIPIDVVLNTTTTGTELITASSSGSIGVNAYTIDNIQVDGALTADGVNEIGETTINLNLIATNRWSVDIYAKIPIGTSLTVAGNSLVTTSESIWTNDGSLAVDVNALTVATTGGEGVVLTGQSYMFIYGLINTPTIGGTIVGDLSGETATVQDGYDKIAYVYNNSLPVSTQSYVNIYENTDGKYRQAENSKGTAQVTYGKAALVDIAFTMNGKWTKCEDRVLQNIKAGCSAKNPTSGSRLYFDDYDTRRHPIDSVAFDFGNEVVVEDSQSYENTIGGFHITDINPTSTINLGQRTVAEFAPDWDRKTNKKFGLIYIHTGYFDTSYTRIAHIFPNAQYSAMDGRGDINGFDAHDLSITATNTCDKIEKDLMYFF